MEKIYAFDLDGTLTAPRQPIDAHFNMMLVAFAKQNPVYLVTGSHRSKIEAQLPAETIDACAGMFACSGAEMWIGERLIYRKQHTFPVDMVETVERLVGSSAYEGRCSKPVECHPGTVNLSTIGHDATREERGKYHLWDQLTGERQEFIRILQSSFPQYEVSAGGQVSIDIVPRGWTKAVAKTEIERHHPHCSITFFGDRMQEGGNDKPLADVLQSNPNHHVVPVDSYLETWSLLHGCMVQAAA